MLASGLFAVLAANNLHAQASPEPRYILQTGSAPLVSETVDLPATSSGPVGVQFFFGFATDEEFQAGQFFDSLSIGVQNQGAPADGTLYLVVDASGITLTPPTPGMIPLDPAMISLTPVPFPSGLSSLEHRMAFSFFAPVPESLASQPFTLYFDLFDNGDAVHSLAWASEVVVVPEPSAAAILLVASIILFCAVCFRRGRAREWGGSRIHRQHFSGTSANPRL